MDKDKIREERERSYEYGLPSYLQHDLDAYKKGLKRNRLYWIACGENCMAVLTLQKSMMEV